MQKIHPADNNEHIEIFHQGGPIESLSPHQADKKPSFCFPKTGGAIENNSFRVQFSAYPKRL
jgi:hypothetical protein